MNESINSKSSTKEQNKNEQFYSFQHENNEAVSDRKKKNSNALKVGTAGVADETRYTHAAYPHADGSPRQTRLLNYTSATPNLTCDGSFSGTSGMSGPVVNTFRSSRPCDTTRRVKNTSRSTFSHERTQDTENKNKIQERAGVMDLSRLQKSSNRVVE